VALKEPAPLWALAGCLLRILSEEQADVDVDRIERFGANPAIGSARNDVRRKGRPGQTAVSLPMACPR
jgi:hypothetical protein